MSPLALYALCTLTGFINLQFQKPVSPMSPNEHPVSPMSPHQPDEDDEDEVSNMAKQLPKRRWQTAYYDKP